VCGSCGHNTKGYRNIASVTPLRRHKTPGTPMIQKEEIENIRDGPIIGTSAVIKFHGNGLIPKETLVVFYPSGINALNYPILLEFISLGYDVCVMYYDSLSSQYF
jgi:hypothetical protein